MQPLCLFCALALSLWVSPLRVGVREHPRKTEGTQRAREHLGHAKVVSQEVDAAVRSARVTSRPSKLRVLFVSPAAAHSPFASTGGQRNVAFLSVGASRLGMQVTSFLEPGETADFLAAQRTGVVHPSAATYVEAANVPRLRALVEAFARARAQWRASPERAAARAEVFAVYDAATALMAPSPQGPDAIDAARDYPEADPLRATLLQLCFAQQLGAALAVHAADVCVTDLSDHAVAALLATHAGNIRVVWYVQNAGHGPDDALIAQHATVVACSDSALAAKRNSVALARPAHVVPNGVAMARFFANATDAQAARRALHLPEDAYVVGQIGYLDAVKDQRTTVRAFVGLAAQFPNAYLVLVGGLTERAYVRDVEALLRQRGLEHRVCLLGVVDDVATVLPALDVVVSASRAEGFGLAAAEAMAARRAVVLTNIAPFVALGGDAVQYFAPGDAPALASLLRQLVERDARERWADRASAHVQAIGTDHAQMLASFVRTLGVIAGQPTDPPQQTSTVPVDPTRTARWGRRLLGACFGLRKCAG